MDAYRLTVWLSRAGLALAVAALLALAAAGPGYRLGWWELGTAFSLFRWAAWGGVAAGALALAALLVNLRGRAPGTVWRSVLAVALALAVVGTPWYWRDKARSVPPIHDITTDTEDPPAFVEILPLRAEAPNPTEYAGAEVAEQQRAAYPDIETLTFDQPPGRVFDAALAAARSMGWDIVAAVPGEGRIEAVATTFWFGFRDDVAIRVWGTAGGTAVDVRSVSRVGRSDVGANAARIRAFTDELRGRL